MKPESKQAWLDVAETLDAYRIFPRIGYALLLFFLWDVHIWFKGEEFTGWAAELYAPLVWGGVAALGKVYIDSGRKWG
jgi:hypothetical protein